ncbi:MAG: MOSC N-terminal beta barrel domain-containing protein, partial [Pseudomonadota bacterium]
MTESCRITALYAYPVKSCRGNTLSSIEISPQGVSGDRQLVILQNDRFINQARLPALAKLAATRIDLEEIELAHGADASLRHRIAAQGRELTIEYYGNQVPVIDQGDALAEFASTVVGTPIRLAALKSSFTRAIPLPEFSIVDGIEQNRFVDAAPILLTNVGSLDDLNTRLETPVPMGRFRPNIVV